MTTQHASLPRSGVAPTVVIIGAGPAGLTAAYELTGCGIPAVVLESDRVPGGLARTAEYKGYRFDIGGHRFFTRVARVERMWREVLGSDLIECERLSRIYFRSHLFQYPLEVRDALSGLGLREALACVLSFCRAQLFPRTNEADLESWLVNRFGERLFTNFFESYTEKVWGIPCRKIQAEWAAQRIQSLSLRSLIWSALRREDTNSQPAFKTLVRHFQYPRLGPGMMWAQVQRIVEARGGRVMFGAPVVEIDWEKSRVLEVRTSHEVHRASHFISSMPIRQLVNALKPAAPKTVQDSAARLRYRDFLTVALILDENNLFPDHWIYIHDPRVHVGRIQNYNNWSRDMIPIPGTTCLGLEYFCSEGDRLWSLSDDELIELARNELAALGLAAPERIVDGTVVRMEKAYPVYDASYRNSLSDVRNFLQQMANLQLVGRNGMHRYNNQDHSMLTAMLAAENIMGARHDIWTVNVDAVYQEQGDRITSEEIRAFSASQPRIPFPVADSREPPVICCEQ